MKITADMMPFKELNEQVRASEDREVVIMDCNGQRYIGAGLADKEIIINGTPGNALGAYLNGAQIKVYGNAQDATGDTMNAGVIIIYGNSGDATGYAMRGGKILVQGNIGYRAGIHMKAYQDKIPVLVVGGEAGSFLGEYQAGGRIVLLRQESGYRPFFCNFCATGMHGGKIFVRTDVEPSPIPKVMIHPASVEDKEEIRQDVEEFCAAFGGKADEVLAQSFYVLTPDTQNPYKELYTQN